MIPTSSVLSPPLLLKSIGIGRVGIGVFPNDRRRSQREVPQRKTRRLDSAARPGSGPGRRRCRCGERRGQSGSPRGRGIRVAGSPHRKRSAAPSLGSRRAARSARSRIGSEFRLGRFRCLARRHGARRFLGAAGRSRNHAVARRASSGCVLHGIDAANHTSSEHGCAELDGDDCGVQGSPTGSPALAQDVSPDDDCRGHADAGPAVGAGSRSCRIAGPSPQPAGWAPSWKRTTFARR